MIKLVSEFFNVVTFDDCARVSFNLISSINMTVLVGCSQPVTLDQVVLSASVENKNSRFFQEHNLNEFVDSLQQKLNSIKGRFTFQQLLSLLKQEVNELRELQFN